jgi:hypothetical protein
MEKLDENSENFQKKIVEMDIERDKLEKLPLLKEQFEKVESRKGDLDVLFSEEKIVELVQEIERMAEETGNSIKISVDEKKDNKTQVKKENEDDENNLLSGFSEEEYFKIRVDVTGDYPGLIKFIDKFDDLKYYNSLIGFNILSGENNISQDKRNISVGSNRANPSLVSEDFAEDEKNNIILESKLEIVFYLGKDK